MPAYVLVDVDVTDADAYERYKEAAQKTVFAFGGKYLVRGGPIAPIEGEWPLSRLVLLEFPDAETAQRWVRSPEYRAAREHRLGAARFRAVLVEGKTLTG